MIHTVVTGKELPVILMFGDVNETGWLKCSLFSISVCLHYLRCIFPLLNSGVLQIYDLIFMELNLRSITAHYSKSLKCYATFSHCFYLPAEITNLT